MLARSLDFADWSLLSRLKRVAPSTYFILLETQIRSFSSPRFRVYPLVFCLLASKYIPEPICTQCTAI